MATASSPDDIRSATRRYLVGFVVLVVLTGIAVGVVTQIADGSTRAVVALGIAGIEAVVALMLFMRIKAEPWVIYGSLALTAVCLTIALTVPLWSERDHITGTRHRVWDAGVVTPGSAGAGGGH